MPKFALKRNVTPGPSSLPIPRTLDISSLESWLWEAACVIRGPVDAPKFKDYILPLIFLKRLSDVFDDELANLARDLEVDLAEAEQLAADDHSVVRLYIPPPARWAAIKERSTGLGQELIYIKNGFAEGRFNESGDGVPHLSPFNVTTDGAVDLSKVKSVRAPAPGSPYWINTHDVIFNNTNSEELIGKTAYFGMDDKFVLSNHMSLCE